MKKQERNDEAMCVQCGKYPQSEFSKHGLCLFHDGERIRIEASNSHPKQWMLQGDWINKESQI
jgi:hypothetical protein